MSGVWIPRPDRKEPSWVKAQCERLQNHCYMCGRIGHDRRICPSRASEGDGEDLRFGTWLSVQPARNNDGEIICCCNDWEEAEGQQWKSKEEVEEEPIAANTFQSPTMMASRGNDVVGKGGDVLEARSMVGGKESGLVKKVYRRQEASRGKVNLSKKCGTPIQVAGKEVTRETSSVEKENIESPKKSADYSKAIVVFGDQSPLSELSQGVKRLRLKRELEGTEDGINCKRRKLLFDNTNFKCSFVQKEAEKEGGRRSIRILKRRLRKEREVKTKKNEIIVVDNRSVQVEEVDIVDSGCDGIEGVLAEGNGSWPKTATIRP